MTSILILGAGAMGALFGGRLSRSLTDDWRVTLADIWPEHVAAMRDKGLEVTDEEGTRPVKVRAVLMDEVDEPFDFIMVFTKAQHTEGALEKARAAIGPETVLVSLQNGLGNKERLAKFADPKRIIIGMTTYTSDLLGPGRIRTHGGGVTKLMSAYGAADDPALTAFSLALADSGLNGEIDTGVEKQIWKKVGFNSAFNALCAVTRLDCGRVGSTEEGQGLLFDVARECAAVAAACGVNLKGEEVIDLLKESLHSHARHIPSMLQDVLAGRPTEIEALNGAVIRYAREHGVSVPINELIYKLVLAISGAKTEN